MFQCSFFFSYSFSNYLLSLSSFAAKLGDTKELDIFIDMLDRELAGECKTTDSPYHSVFFFILFAPKLTGRQAAVCIGDRDAARLHVLLHIQKCLVVATLFLPGTVPFLFISEHHLWCKCHVWQLRWTIYTPFSDNSILDYMSIMIVLSALKQHCRHINHKEQNMHPLLSVVSSQRELQMNRNSPRICTKLNY